VYGNPGRTGGEVVGGSGGDREGGDDEVGNPGRTGGEVEGGTSWGPIY
jgi:hypothetical protein